MAVDSESLPLACAPPRLVAKLSICITRRSMIIILKCKYKEPTYHQAAKNLAHLECQWDASQTRCMAKWILRSIKEHVHHIIISACLHSFSPLPALEHRNQKYTQNNPRLMVSVQGNSASCRPRIPVLDDCTLNQNQ